jgi:pyruvate/2-oxoglutarate dehydrogenase complex dihydrolipoamide dehydrogenase (E3) component
VARGVRVRRGAVVRRVARAGDTVVAEVDDGSTIHADRVLIAVGKRARTTGIGLRRLGLDPDQPLPVGPDARVDCPGSVWAIGDVAGKGQYTHLANHHGAVLANHLTGDRTRRLDDVVSCSCVFTDPPVISVGATRAELADDADVVWAEHSLDGLPRSLTDALGPGFLAVAARRSTGTVVSAHGVGARFDELVHALVVAVDGKVPLAVLARSMQPFPTIGEILGVAFRTLLTAVGPDVQPGGTMPRLPRIETSALTPPTTVG